MVRRISSQGSSMSMAMMSTRAVMTSEAEMSAKSIAALTSSEASSSRTSSSSAISIIVCSSSRAASLSSSSTSGSMFVIRFTSVTTIAVTGFKMIIRALIGYANFIAKLVAFFLALILGIVSPNMMTRTVITAVDTHAYCSLRSSITAMEPIEEAAILTRLLPTRIVEMASSNFSAILKATVAFLLPLSLSCSRRTLLQAEKDISDAEKNAEHMTHTIIPTI